MQSFEAADNLYLSREHQKGFDELNVRLENGEKTCDLLWRMCRFCHDLSTTLSGNEKKEMIFKGRDLGLQATEMDPMNAEAIKWASILFGMSVDLLPTKEKISEGGKLKDMLDKALELNPTDFALLHLRARFFFTLANLSWLERKAASMLYDEVPKATIDDALVDFEEAQKHQSDWIENLFYLSKCYLAKKDKTKARDILSKAVSLPTCTKDEISMVQECKKLLEKC